MRRRRHAVKKRLSPGAVRQSAPGGLLALVAIGAALQPASAFEPGAPADQPPAGEGDVDGLPDAADPFDDLLDDGSIDLLFEDFDIVVTAGRSEQSLALSAVPVSVIDADDIRYSGARDVQSLLRFVPGVDVLQIGRNQWAIGVLGLHQVSSDRTLLLTNGRNASNPIFGGFDLQRLPVFLPDVERVEVVRGPAGGAWGANAFNGVINIIEASPRETTGVYSSLRINEFGDFRANLRIGAAGERFAWRVHTEFDEHEATGDPIVTVALSSPTSEANDFGRFRKFAFDGVYDLGDRAEIDFGIAYTHTERGTSPFLNTQFAGDDRIDYFRAHAKLAFETDAGGSGYVQWYGAFQDVNIPSQYRYGASDQTLEMQYNFSPVQGHEISVGATARFVHAVADRNAPSDLLSDGALGEQWLGVFVGDRWSFADGWLLEGQARVDWYSETEADFAGRVALLRELDEDGRHVLRFAGARAFRTPQAAIRDANGQLLALPGPGPTLFGLTFVDPAVDDNETVYSAEIGYTGRYGDHITLRGDVFYHRYQDLTGLIALPEPAPTVGRLFVSLDNIGEAHAFGGEFEIAYETERFDVSLWYAYAENHLDSTKLGARAYLPVEHKAGVNARLKLTDWLTASANYRYTDGGEEPAGLTPLRAPVRHRLDLAATLGSPDGRFEWQAGISDVFDASDERVATVTAPALRQPGLGRTFFTEIRARF